MRIAVILVHYRTPDLAAAAIEAVERDALGAGFDVEGILVDNGSDEAGRTRLEALRFARIDPGRNLGFAGGVNLGIERSRAETILVMNPDVRILPGCLRALVGALDGGAAVVGPRFYWDESRRMLLPPAEERSRRAELLTLAAARGELWARRARRRWRHSARRHWNALRPLASYALSGSLLALTRTAWRRVGPFDESFQLYFEETDWLRRLQRRGLPARYVPAAEAIHLHGRSAVLEPASGRWFAESARRFRSRYYGRWFAGLLEELDSRWPRHHVVRPPPVPEGGLDLAGHPFPLWIEVSPNAVGFPAAAERLAAPPTGAWKLPPDCAARLAGAELTLQIVDQGGRELDRWSLPAAAAAAGQGDAEAAGGTSAGMYPP